MTRDALGGPSQRRAAGRDYDGGMILASLFLTLVVPCEDIRFPPNVGLLDLTEERTYDDGRTLAAVPDDGLDDREAIQRVLDAHPSGNRVFYLPNGVYNLSGPIRFAAAQGHAKRNVLQGQSEAGTVLRLQASAKAADGSPLSGSVVDFNNGSSAQNFRNGVRNLTVEVGPDNPLATGVHFRANNRGRMDRVTIRAAEGSGAIGLSLSNDLNGPLLITDVTVEGFDVGVRGGGGHANSQTIDGLTLRGQRTAGLLNAKGNYNALFVRGVRSENACEAVVGHGIDPSTTLLLIDSTLTGGSPDTPAVRISRGYLSNVETAGYDPPAVLKRKTAASGWRPRETPIAAGQIADGFYAVQKGRLPEDGPRFTIEPERPPKVPWGDPSDWVSPTRFGGDPADRPMTKRREPIPDADDTAAIQAALDAGSHTVVLDNGRWALHGEVVVPPHVRRIIGAECFVEGTGRWVFRGDGDPVVFERIENRCPIVQDSARTLVLSSTEGDFLTGPDGTGDVFIDDFISGKDGVRVRGLNVYARQLNTEIRGKVHVLNDGGRLWLLGHKTEQANCTFHKVVGGGRTEVLGSFNYLNSGETGMPWFVAEDATFALTGWKTYNHKGGAAIDREAQVVLEEARGGRTTRTPLSADFGAGVWTPE